MQKLGLDSCKAFRLSEAPPTGLPRKIMLNSPGLEGRRIRRRSASSIDDEHKHRDHEQGRERQQDFSKWEIQHL